MKERRKSSNDYLLEFNRRLEELEDELAEVRCEMMKDEGKLRVGEFLLHAATAINPQEGAWELSYDQRLEEVEYFKDSIRKHREDADKIEAAIYDQKRHILEQCHTIRRQRTGDFKRPEDFQIVCVEPEDVGIGPNDTATFPVSENDYNHISRGLKDYGWGKYFVALTSKHSGESYHQEGFVLSITKMPKPDKYGSSFAFVIIKTATDKETRK